MNLTEQQKQMMRRVAKNNPRYLKYLGESVSTKTNITTSIRKCIFRDNKWFWSVSVNGVEIAKGEELSRNSCEMMVKEEIALIQTKG